MGRTDERELARRIAEDVAAAGGRVYFVGGLVRDELRGMDSKDIDLEVYGISPQTLRDILSRHGTVLEKGASFGVLGLMHTDMDIAMPRRERRTGAAHTDFDVSVDPFLSVEDASMRRDFTVNAMMKDVLSGEIVDCWGGKKDLREGILRCVSANTFVEDALRVFRAAQFAARMEMTIDADTLALCRTIDVTALTRERVFEEMCKALLKAKKPSVFFRSLLTMDHLKEFFPEIEALKDVPQNPAYHPEGDVFEHTMLVIDQAALLRERAVWPLGLMVAALLHDLGKTVATTTTESGRIIAHGHEAQGTPLVIRQLERLTSHEKLIRYAVNMGEMHMRPNMMANNRSKKSRTRAMFDLSVCPEDLILLSRADASGMMTQYNEGNEVFLRERLDDYRAVMQRPMVTGADLIAAGEKPSPRFKEMLERAKTLHFAGIEKNRALKQILHEYAGK